MRVEKGFGVGFGESVPGANVLADIAAEGPIVEFALEFIGDFIFKFDGKIGYTFAAIYNVGLDNGLGRTGVDAGRAGTAMIGYGSVIFQIKIYDEFGDKVERTYLLGEQVAVLADPAKSAFGGPCLVQHRRRIDKRPTVDLADLFRNKLLQLF